jgi:hypothetical protein
MLAATQHHTSPLITSFASVQELFVALLPEARLAFCFVCLSKNSGKRKLDNSKAPLHSREQNFQSCVRRTNEQMARFEYFAAAVLLSAGRISKNHS